VRWGIEIVGDVGLGTVEWLDTPLGVVWIDKEYMAATRWHGIRNIFRRLGLRN
jgi:hypothetical protein